MKRLLAGSAVVLLLGATAAQGFDGRRKGFVLGGGAGVVPAAHWSVDVDFFHLERGKADENRAGFGIQFVIGGAFDEHNMLVYEGNVAGFTSDLLHESVTQGFNGASWYHYFGRTGKSVFTALGLGLYYFQIADYNATDPGGAILMGGGYEFAPHWQVGAYLTLGKSTESAWEVNADFEHSNLSVIVSGIAF